MNYNEAELCKDCKMPVEKYDEKTYIKHANKAVNYIQQSKTMSGSGAKWQRLRDAKREIDLALEVLGKK